jgi:hypothetical protein
MEGTQAFVGANEEKKSLKLAYAQKNSREFPRIRGDFMSQPGFMALAAFVSARRLSDLSALLSLGRPPRAAPKGPAQSRPPPMRSG